MTPAEITKLLEHQRAVSQHVANLHKITGKEARGNYLRNVVKDDAMRDEVGRVFSEQFRRIREMDL